MEPPYPIIAYAEGADFGEQLALAFQARGVAAVTGVFSAEECDRAMDGIVGAFERLAPGLDHYRAGTWTRENTPPQTRTGLYQATVGNLPEVWRLRADPRVRRIFSAIYTALRGRPIEDFIVSGDGLNLQPRDRGPYGGGSDWAHLDQTRGNPFLCVQGQAVLTNTTACLRASPGSHLAFAEVLALTGGQAPGGWRRLAAEDYAPVRAAVEARGGLWQIPILAPRGSFLVWASSTVHSAKRADGPVPFDPVEPWSGWRGVVYICLRPREEFTPAQRRARRRAFEENRVTNHWGTKLFPVNPCARYGPPPGGLRFGGGNYVTSPAAVYDLLGRPRLDRGARRLAGYSTESSSSSSSEGGEGPPPPCLSDGELADLLGF